jgi:hypothetical protein
MLGMWPSSWLPVVLVVEMPSRNMACGIYPLLANFGLGEILDGETPVSKLCLPLPEFPVVRLPNKTNDYFHVRVEHATENIVGSYAREEHDVCIASVPNGGRVNRVFDQAGMPYGPCLEPGSEVSKEVVIKRKDDASADVRRCMAGRLWLRTLL